jgi:ATP phosphoribosyltransferase
MTMLLKAVLATEGMIGLKIKIPLKFLEKVISCSSCMYKKPTISQLSDSKWVALEIIIEERIVKK